MKRREGSQGARPVTGQPAGQSNGQQGARAAGKTAAKAAEPRLAKLRILDKEVTIACRPGEEDDLKQAAAYIDQSMRDLRSRNTTSSLEKIAIVTAINTADALLKSRAQRDDDPELLQRISALNLRVNDALETGPVEVDPADT